MSITKYFVGGELEAFVQGSHAATMWSTTAGTYDANFSRGAVSLNSNSGDYIRMPLTSAQASCWVSFQDWRAADSLGGPNSQTWHQFLNASLTPIYRLQGIGGSYSQPLVQFQYWSGSAWVGIGAGRVIPTGALHKFDYNLVSNATTGTLAAYVDGVPLGSLTGNTAFVSPGTLSEVRTLVTSGLANLVTISEGMILDTSTLGRRLATLYLTADGATNTWTPSTGTSSVATVDEAGTYSDTAYTSSPTAGQIYTGVTSDLSTTAQQYAVDAVVIAYRAQKGAVGPQNLQGVVRVGGSNYASSSVANLNTGMGYTWAAFDSNPATSAAWTPSDINTAGFETGAESAT